jgi:hypothetical protein
VDLLRGGGDGLRAGDGGLRVAVYLLELVAAEVDELDGEPRREPAHEQDQRADDRLGDRLGD